MYESTILRHIEKSPNTQDRWGFLLYTIQQHHVFHSIEGVAAF